MDRIKKIVDALDRFSNFLLPVAGVILIIDFFLLLVIKILGK